MRRSAEPRPRRWATTAEAAAYAHVSPRTMERYVLERYVPSYRIRGRTVRIDLDDVDTRLLRPNTGYEAP